jgi:hypothetical protein
MNPLILLECMLREEIHIIPGQFIQNSIFHKLGDSARPRENGVLNKVS